MSGWSVARIPGKDAVFSSKRTVDPEGKGVVLVKKTLLKISDLLTRQLKDIGPVHDQIAGGKSRQQGPLHPRVMDILKGLAVPILVCIAREDAQFPHAGAPKPAGIQPADLQGRRVDCCAPGHRREVELKDSVIDDAIENACI